jgi:SAM-dependent methyltransferase
VPVSRAESVVPFSRLLKRGRQSVGRVLFIFRVQSSMVTSGQLSAYALQYRQGQPRARVFHDIVLEDLTRFGQGAVVLDIGCGHGFDGTASLQRSLAEKAKRYIGIDPEATDAPTPASECHKCPFEEAPLERSFVHLAFSVFVQEHLDSPTRFWNKLWDTLVPGGVYWGFTVDARHPFSAASSLMDSLGIKDWYLDSLFGRRGVERYENFPTYYLANSPRRILKHTKAFSAKTFFSLHRVGQLTSYFPRVLRPLVRAVESFTIAADMPGSILLVRLEK